LMNSIESVEEKLAGGADPQDMYVKVSVYRCDGESVIEVRDTGMGMDEEQIRQCTDPFFTTKPQGHGMGLAITRMYLKENAGRLEVESVAGEHTTMKMVFAEVDHGNE
nr:hypothetical protein [Clostridia bacterium]